MGAKKINVDWFHSFVEFEHVFEGWYKTAWKQILHENFPEMADLAMVPNKQDPLRTEIFFCSVELFIKKALH